jgi:hypothetical protein
MGMSGQRLHAELASHQVTYPNHRVFNVVDILQLAFPFFLR